MKALTDPVDLTEYAASRAAALATEQKRPAGSVVLLTPFTGLVSDVARIIAQLALPEGDLAFQKDLGLVVDLTGRPDVASDVRRWADALGTDVTEQPEVTGGRLWTFYEAQGRLPNLVYCRVVARSLITETAR